MARTRPQLDRHRESPRPAAPRWLLFVHLLPSSPSNLRVRTWRRLQQIGALAIKQSVYVLPDSPSAREDFEWLKTEIEGSGGQASVFAADTVDQWSNDALVDEFRRSREESYDGLTREAEKTLNRGSARSRAARKRAAARSVQQLRERLAAIERIDFFGSAGRDRAASVIRTLEERTSPDRRGTVPSASGQSPGPFNARTWVTRPRPGVDRMASAWLIRRFIDPDARIAFVADREAAPPDSVPFDMFGVEFTHRGEQCTFEMLCETFRLTEPALTGVAAVVHDLDLKDHRFGAPEAATVGLIIDGLRLAHTDDQELLAAGMTLFEALYRAFAQAQRTAGPRPVARRRRATVKRKSG